MTKNKAVLPGLLIGGVVLVAATIWAFAAQTQAIAFSRLFGNAWQLLVAGLLGGFFGTVSGTGDAGLYVPGLQRIWASGVRGAGFNAALLDGGRLVATGAVLQAFGLAAGVLALLHGLLASNMRTGDANDGHGLGALALPHLIVGVPATLIAYRSEVWINYRQQLLGWMPAIIVAFGLIILALALTRAGASGRRRQTFADSYVMCLLAAIGGIGTALVSVGTGALAVIYLLARGYPALTAAGTGAIGTLGSVLTLTAAVASSRDIGWTIILAAIPGAILGGLIVRAAMTFLSGKSLVALGAAAMTASGLYQLAF